MAQLSDIKSPQPLVGIVANNQPVGRPAEFVTEVLSAPSHCHHGKVLLVKQTRLDLVSIFYTLCSRTEPVNVCIGLDPNVLLFITRAVPKFMKRMKVPDYKDKNVFGVPLIVHVQRSGQPLPLGLQQALRYLRSQCLDQVSQRCTLSACVCNTGLI